jgi:hypothetical protein
MGGGAVNGMPIFPRELKNHDEKNKKAKVRRRANKVRQTAARWETQVKQNLEEELETKTKK